MPRLRTLHACLKKSPRHQKSVAFKLDLNMKKSMQFGFVCVLLGLVFQVSSVHSQTEEESKAGPKVCFNPETLISTCPPVSQVRAFDFSAVDSSGAITKALGKHHCVRDNVTKLIWSTQSLQLMAGTDAMNAGAGYSRCGFSTGWRLPTYRELVSIVQYGKAWPSIDTNYFPNTATDWYWVSDEVRPVDRLAAIVNFRDGGTNVQFKSYSGNVYLVRSGP
jgi:hypothetical protein